MKDVISTEEMRAADAAAIAAGTPGRELMRRAAEALASAENYEAPISIVCGTGNNAGDGYAAALLLFERGLSCRLFLTEEKFSPDGKYYFDLCRERGIPYEILTSPIDFSGYPTVFDCLYGTGFHGEPTGIAAEAIEAINQSGAYVVSADINSGLCGDSGRAAGACVRSDLTLSIGTRKFGHYLGSAKDLIGKLKNADIGIPLSGESAHLLEKSDVAPLFSGRRHDSHKGVYGYVTLIGGSIAYSGAAKLANLSLSALRAGAGVARLAVPGFLTDAVLPYLLESTLFPLSDREKELIFSPEEIDALLSSSRAIAVGMGLGQSEEAEKLVRYLLEKNEKRLILDADALNLLGKEDDPFSLLQKARGKVILTPHLKEFERLSKIPMTEILADPVGKAKAFAGKTGTILLLKGATTVITDGERVYLSDRGSAGMATAGSGDVLSGVLAGICGYADEKNLLLGVAGGAFLAGLAGELAAKVIPEAAMLSSDTVRFLPDAMREILA